MKVVRGHVHKWRKQFAVESRRCSPFLHALYDRNVLST